MAERTYSIENTIAALAEAKKYSTLRDILSTMNPSDLASVFEELDNPSALPRLFRLLPKELAAEAFVEMESETQELLIQGFSDTELKEVVDELYVDDAVDLVEEMPSNVVKRILRQADAETRRLINEMLKYPEDSAGSIMTTEFVSLRPKMTVEEAEKRIRRTGVDKATINTCYVTDQGKLIGAISIRTLLLSDHDAVISDIMEENVISVTTTDDQEDVAQAFSKYNFSAMPVVDKEGRLVGVVTVDDAMDVMEEEATEDMEIMAGMSPSERPYLHTGVVETWKARITWLLPLMLSAALTGFVLNHYEGQLSSCLVLSAFIPLLCSTAGNSGTQASVAIIRGLALDELDMSNLGEVIWKELRVALLCGVCLAAANFVKMIAVDMALLHNGVTVGVAAAVCLTLVVVVLFAKLVGCSLPILAGKLGFDPAVIASPVVSSIVDVLSLLVYFRVAALLLPELRG
ncbi:MAG: magnesium transporter [Clostridiales bacterium]|nr:magnesium transporter [Candidatus Apopatocola equi]